jgi:hypothetical protein
VELKAEVGKTLFVPLNALGGRQKPIQVWLSLDIKTLYYYAKWCNWNLRCEPPRATWTWRLKHSNENL